MNEKTFIFSDMRLQNVFITLKMLGKQSSQNMQNLLNIEYDIGYEIIINVMFDWTMKIYPPVMKAL